MDGSPLTTIWFKTFWLYDGEKQQAFSRNHNLNFEVLSFSGLVLGGTTLSHDAGQQQRATVPRQPQDP